MGLLILATNQPHNIKRFVYGITKEMQIKKKTVKGDRSEYKSQLALVSVRL